MALQNPPPVSASPKWGSTTKLIVGLTIVAITAALLIQFRTIIGPLILAFILAYLLHPVAGWLSTRSKLPWRTAVNLIYLLLLIVLIGLFTLTGFAVVQQLQSLIGFVQTFVTNLPNLIADLSSRVFRFGPFSLDLAQFDLTTITNQLLTAAQTIVSKAGIIVSTLATSAVTTMGWLLFVLVISYFLLADTGRVSNGLIHVDIPGYDYDLRRLTEELKRIWNVFLRGQFIMVAMVMLVYIILMSILGMQFALGIAILAGLARFVPYLGPLILWITISVIAFFQGGNYFGLQPWQYVILVLAFAIITDQIFDNLISPRFFGRALGVHPAAVLVAAIIAARLIGLIGLVLAAPSLATLVLISRYVLRKMFDMEPFPMRVEESGQEGLPWGRAMRQVGMWWETLQRRR